MHLLIGLRVVESIDIPDSHQLFVLLWQHRSHGFNAVAFVYFPVEFPLLYNSFSEELLFFAKESDFAFLVLLGNIVKNLEVIDEVEHVKAIVLDQRVKLSPEYKRLIKQLLSKS